MYGNTQEHRAAHHMESIAEKDPITGVPDCPDEGEAMTRVSGTDHVYRCGGCGKTACTCSNPVY